MFGKIFGKKEGMYFMEVYWDYDVNTDDLVSDLNTLGYLVMRPSAQKDGCRMDIVRDDNIDGTDYRMAELHVNKTTEKLIRELVQDEKFAAVKFTRTHMTNKGKAV